jgi:hypothetical protein
VNKIIQTIEKFETLEQRYGFMEKMKTKSRKRYNKKPATREEIDAAMVDYINRGGKITRIIVED